MEKRIYRKSTFDSIENLQEDQPHVDGHIFRAIF